MPDGARGRLETGGFDFVRTVLSDDLLVLPYAWFEYFYVFKGVFLVRMQSLINPRCRG